MSRVFVIGPASWNLLIHLPQLPRPEPQMMVARWHHETLGGTSAGKALNLRRLGAQVTLCTLLGDDPLGDRILDTLQAAGIDVIAGRSGNGSERHVNLMDTVGRRVSIYLTLPTAAGTAGDDDAVRCEAAVATADAVVVDLADHSRRVLAMAQARGKAIWCDLHDYDGRSSFHTEFRDAATFLFVSDERLPDPEAFLREQLARGKQLVVCTRGADGAMAIDTSGEIVEMPAQPIPDLVDTNGAGDAFFAGFLTSHLAGRSLRECLQAATHIAASSVRSPDLVTGDGTPT